MDFPLFCTLRVSCPRLPDPTGVAGRSLWCCSFTGCPVKPYWLRIGQRKRRGGIRGSHRSWAQGHSRFMAVRAAHRMSFRREAAFTENARQRRARRALSLMAESFRNTRMASRAEEHHQHQIKKFRNRSPRSAQDTKKPVPSGRHRKRCLEFSSTASINCQRRAPPKLFRDTRYKGPAWRRHPYSRGDDSQ